MTTKPPEGMDDTELVLSYLFEMHTTGQDARLTEDDLILLMDYITELEQYKKKERPF